MQRSQAAASASLLRLPSSRPPGGGLRLQGREGQRLLLRHGRRRVSPSQRHTQGGQGRAHQKQNPCIPKALAAVAHSDTLRPAILSSVERLVLFLERYIMRKRSRSVSFVGRLSLLQRVLYGQLNCTAVGTFSTHTSESHCLVRLSEVEVLLSYFQDGAERTGRWPPGPAPAEMPLQ